MRHYGILLFFAGLIAILPERLPGQSEDTYAIKFVRAAKTGDRYGVTVKGWDYNNDKTVSADGSVLAETRHAIAVELAGSAEVHSVNRDAQPDRILYNLDRLLATENGNKKNLLPAGTRVAARQIGIETRFDLEGKPAGKEIDTALRLVIFFGKDETPNDDDLFGTNERRRVGDQWDINKEKAVLAFKELGFTPQASDISGTVMLNDVRKEDGVDVLEISSNIEFSESTQGKTTKLAARYRILAPVNPDHPLLEQSMQLVYTVQRHVKGKSTEAVYETKLDSGYEARFRPAAKTGYRDSERNPGRQAE